MNHATQRFIQSVLPTQGLYIIVRDIEGKMKHDVFNSKSVITTLCSLNSQPTTNCWFALASYKQSWHTVTTATGTRKALRTRDNIMLVKSMWLDIDVGEGKHYKERSEALQDLNRFINELGLPRPWILASGEKGLHVYFVFNEDVDVDTWQYLAARLKQACVELKLHADAVRTADAASILRLPLTWNLKGTVPHQVLIMEEGISADYATYKQILDGFTPVKSYNTLPRLPDINLDKLPNVSFDENFTKLVMDKYFSPDLGKGDLRNPVDVIGGCEQMRLQANAPEPVWRGMLAVMRFCEHGHRVSHKLSSQHPNYDKADTDAKIAWLEDKDISPYTCAEFYNHRPDVCLRCPNWGLIKSPISAKRALVNIPVKNVDETTGPAEETKEPEVNGQQLAEIKTKNSLVNAMGCHVRVAGEDGEKYWKVIYPYPVYPLQIVDGINPKGETSISYIFRKHGANGHKDILIDGGTLTSSSINTALGNCGFLLQDKERRLMANLLIDILRETEGSIGVIKPTDRLGWDDELKSFLLGGKLYKDNGDVIELSVSGKAKPFSDITKPVGSLETWKKIADVYNKDGLEWGQAVVASAFASPLMKLGALEQAALLFITGEKGVGKSTALLLASSVYGSPERLMFNKMDTPNSRFHKLGIYSNITAAFDEMTDLSPREASEFAYTLTQGRGKDRMGSGGEDLLLNTTRWSCLPVMSANDSIISALGQHGTDPTAQMSRVLEVKATDINDFYTEEEVETNERLVRQLPLNYGLAGDVFMRYVTTHKDEILEDIHQVEKLFKKHAGLNSNHRFWSYMCTRMIVGVRIAKRLGLLNYDVAKFSAYLIKQVIAAKDSISKYKFNMTDVVSAFLNVNIPNRLVVKSSKRPKEEPDDITKGSMNDIGYVTQSPAAGRELRVRVEVKECMCVVSVDAVKEYSKNVGITLKDFLDAVEQQYTIVTRRTKRDMGEGTIYRGAGKVECVVFKLPKEFLMSELEDDLDTTSQGGKAQDDFDCPF